MVEATGGATLTEIINIYLEPVRMYKSVKSSEKIDVLTIK